MTVKQLIESLSKIEDQDSLVMKQGYEGGYNDVMEINTKPIDIALDVNQDWWYGKHEKVEDVTPHYLDKFQIVKAIIL